MELHGPVVWECTLGKALRNSPFVNMVKASFKTLSKDFPASNFVLDESQNERITTSLAWCETALRNKLRKTKHPTKNGK